MMPPRRGERPDEATGRRLHRGPDGALHRQHHGTAADPLWPGAGAALRAGATATLGALLGAGSLALERLSLCLDRRPLYRWSATLRGLRPGPLAVERLSLRLGPCALALASALSRSGSTGVGEGMTCVRPICRVTGEHRPTKLRLPP